jgi:hypothetical protein
MFCQIAAALGGTVWDPKPRLRLLIAWVKRLGAARMAVYNGRTHLTFARTRQVATLGGWSRLI